MFNLTNNSKRTRLVFALLAICALSLTACEKSKLKVRAAVSNTPNSGITPDSSDHHEDETYRDHEDEKNPELILPEDEVADEKDPEDRDDRFPEQPKSTDHLPRVVVVSNKNTDVYASEPHRGADLKCSVEGHCDDNNKTEKPDEKLPPKDTPPPHKTINNDRVKVITHPTKTNNAIPIKTTTDTNVVLHSIDNSTLYDFHHFHIIIEVDPNAIKKNSKPLNTDNKETVINIVKDFVKGFDKHRSAAVNNKGLNFTLGLVAATTHPQFTGRFIFLKEFNTKRIDEIGAELRPELEFLSGDTTKGDGNTQIYGGHPLVSLTNLIENNPKSINKNTDFLSENIPTAILTIGSSRDRCNLEYSVGTNSSCESQHNFKTALRSMIRNKVFKSTLNYFAPVSFKEILIKQYANEISVIKNDEKRTSQIYNPVKHGELFSEQILVKPTLFALPKNMVNETLVLKNDDRLDPECLINDGYVYTKNSGLEVQVMVKALASDVRSDETCRPVNKEAFLEQIIYDQYITQSELLNEDN